MKKLIHKIYHFFTKTRLRKILSCVLAILMILTSIKFVFFGPKEASAAWFDDGWGYRKMVSFGNTGAADSNKKVKIDFDTSTPISEGKMQSSGADIRVTDINGQLLSHHILSSGSSVKIDDAGNPGQLWRSNRQVVRTSTGALYSVIYDSPNLEVWKSSDEGASWDEQDSANNPSSSSQVGIAIDSSDNLHIAYSTGDALKYIKFTTSTGLFGSSETVYTETRGLFTNAVNADAIAVDSSDVPHVVFYIYWDDDDFPPVSGQEYSYSNRVGGSWDASPVDLETTTTGYTGQIAISEDNIPEIAYTMNATGLRAAVGNVNDATSFTKTTVDATTVNNQYPSIGVDSSGNTWISYVDESGATDYITLVKHNDADAWTSWQTPVTNSNAGTEPSLAIDEGDVYIFYTDENSDIAYDKYTGSWAGEVILQTGTFQDAKARWSYNSNTSFLAYGIDYLYSDGTDVYWNRLIFGPINNTSTDIWVLVPTINSGTTALYVYYGNPTAVSTNASTQFTQSIFTPTSGPTAGSEEQGPRPNLWLKFDEGYGNTTNDDTSNNNDGSISGAAWQSEEYCLNEKCLFFDGADDVVTVTNANSIDFDNNLNDAFTFQAWVRVNSDGENSTGEIFDKGTGTYMRVDSEGTDGLADLEVQVDLATTDPNVNVTNGISLNRWHHVAVTYTDDADDDITVYIDGNVRGTGDGSGAPASGDSNNLLIGGDTLNNFHGFIDEFKVYPRERTQAEINADLLKTAGLHGSSTTIGLRNYSFLSDGLVGYWKMDDAGIDTEGEISTDSSGNGNNGTLMGDNGVGDNGTGMDCTVTGKFGTGCDLDGTDDTVDTTDIMVDSPSTISFMMKLDSAIDNTLATSPVLFSKFNGATHNIKVYFSSTERNSSNKGTLTFGLERNGASSRYEIYTSKNSWNANQWYHVVWVHGATADETKIYVDGVAENTSFLSQAGTHPSGMGYSATFVIGGGNAEFKTGYLDGKLDEFRFYNRALSPAEVSSLYNWAPGPVGYWKLDENTGIAANDSSGNSNTGTITAGAGSFAPAKFGSGYIFDNADTVINAASGTTLDNLPATGMSLSAWIYPKSAGEGSLGFIVAKNVGTTPSSGWVLRLDSTTSLTFTVDGSTDLVRTTSTSMVTQNAWNHVAATWDGEITTASSVKIYVNGLEASYATTTNGASRVDDGTSTFYMGNDSTSARTFDGTIDDVRVYDYVRTSKQIVEDMNAGHPAGGSPVGSPKIYWKLDEQQGTTANNSGSDPSLNGTLQVAATFLTPESRCKINGCVNVAGGGDNVSAGDVSFTDSLTQMTISLWLTPTAVSTNREIVSKWDNSTQNSFRVITDSTNSDELRVYIASSLTDISNYFLTSNLNLAVSTIIHLAIVYDGSLAAADRVKVFKNGSLVSGSVTGTIPTSMTSGSTSNLRIGDGDTGGSSALSSQHDEFKIYDFALTTAERLVDMNAGSTASLGGVLGTAFEGIGPTDPRFGWWKMDENSGTTSTLDSSGDERTMTMTSMEETDWVPGKFGSALDFDGSAEYLTNANRIMTNQTNYIITAWVKPDNTNTGTIYMQGTTSADFPYRALNYESGAVRYRSTNDAGTVQDSVAASTGTLTVGVWNSVALIKGSSTSLTYFVNGVRSTTTVANAGTYANENQTSIGVLRRSTDTQFFDGSLDEIQLFGTSSISTEGILYLYNRAGPVVWYKLDECQNTTANNSAPINSGDAGLDGTITIGATVPNTAPGTCDSGDSAHAWYNGRTGKFNSSLDFDGVDDYVETADDDQLDANDANFTIEAWINRDTFTTDDTVVAKKTNQTTNTGYIIWIDADTDDVNFAVADNTDVYSVNGRTAITSTGWYHIVAVWDEDSATNTTIYVNGIDDKESTSGTQGLVGNVGGTNTLRLGAESDGGEPFDGRIDNFKFYRYDMPASLIKRLFNEGSAQRFGPAEGSP